MLSERGLPVVWCLLTSFFFVSMQVFVKTLSEQLSARYIVSVRSSCLLTLNTAVILLSPNYQGYRDTPGEGPKFAVDIRRTADLLLMMKRQGLLSLSIVVFLSSLEHLPLSVAYSLYNTSPILIFFTEAHFYQTPITPHMLLLTLLAFLGVLIILDPLSSLSAAAFNPWLLAPLLGAASQTLAMIYLHELRGKFDPNVVLQYAYLTQLAVSSLITCLTAQVAASPEAEVSLGWAGVQMGLIVGLAYGAHVFRIKAVFARPPSEVMVYNYFGVVYSIGLDVVVFGASLSWLTILGVLLTSAGLLLHFFSK